MFLGALRGTVTQAFNGKVLPPRWSRAVLKSVCLYLSFKSEIYTFKVTVLIKI